MLILILLAAFTLGTHGASDTPFDQFNATLFLLSDHAPVAQWSTLPFVTPVRDVAVFGTRFMILTNNGGLFSYDPTHDTFVANIGNVSFPAASRMASDTTGRYLAVATPNGTVCVMAIGGPSTTTCATIPMRPSAVVNAVTWADACGFVRRVSSPVGRAQRDDCDVR